MNFTSATPFLGALLAIMLGAAGIPASARSEDSTRLPLPLLVKQAIEANPQVVALQSEIQAAEERVPQAGALPDPMFSYRVERVPLGGVNFLGGPERRFMLSQAFPYPGKRGAMRSMAGQEAEAKRWELAGLRNEIAAGMAESSTICTWSTRASRSSTTARAWCACSPISRAPATRSGATARMITCARRWSLSEETARAAAERAQLKAATARVNLLLDRDPDAVLYPPEWQPAPTPEFDLQALRTLALAVAPTIQARDRDVARDEQGVTLARKDGRPDFTVGLGYMSMKADDDAWMGEFDMSLPLWRGSKVAPHRREAEASLGASRAAREAARNDVLLAVETAWARFAGAEIQVARYRDSALPQADLAVTSNRAAYEHGKGDFGPLIEAVRTQLRYRIENEEALVEREKALAELARSVGDMSLLLGDQHD